MKKSKLFSSVVVALLVVGCGRDATTCEDHQCTPDVPSQPPIEDVVISAIKPLLDSDMLSAEIVCEKCDPSRYEYKWFVDGNLISTDKIMSYSGEDIEVRLDVVGYGSNDQRVDAYEIYEISSPKVYSNNYSYLVHAPDKSIYTFGNPSYGGDKSAIEHLINSDVVSVTPSASGWALLKSDRSVVTFGVQKLMDNALVVEHLLKDVVKVYGHPLGDSFAAILNDGSVVQWGSYAVKHFTEKKYVDVLLTIGGDIGLIAEDGSVVTSGFVNTGGNSSSVTDQLQSGVVSLFGNYGSMGAIKEDKSIVVWGTASSGADTSAVAEYLKQGVTKVYSGNGESYVAYNDQTKRAVYWGRYVGAGVVENVISVVPNCCAYAMLLGDGSVRAIGLWTLGGDVGSAASELSSGVKEIYASGNSYLAVKEDKSVVLWGLSHLVSASSAYEAELNSGLKKVVGRGSAFAVITESGKAFSFGDDRHDFSDSTGVADELESGVKDIIATSGSFMATRSDGNFTLWGSSSSGADESTVPSDMILIVPELKVKESSIKNS